MAITNNKYLKITGPESIYLANPSKYENDIYVCSDKEVIYNKGVKLTPLDGLYQELSEHISDKTNPHGVTKSQVGLGNVSNDAQVKRSEMGAKSGVATLDDGGKVPVSQLPGFVTDVIEVFATYTITEGTITDINLYKDTNHTQVITPESGKIYTDITSNQPGYQFRWSGSKYVPIGDPVVLGTTTGTAYPGDKGNHHEEILDSLPDTIVKSYNLFNNSNSGEIDEQVVVRDKLSDGTYGVDRRTTRGNVIPDAETVTDLKKKGVVSGQLIKNLKAKDTELQTKVDNLEESLDDYIPKTWKGAIGGVAELDSNRIILRKRLPSPTETERGAVSMDYLDDSVTEYVETKLHKADTRPVITMASQTEGGAMSKTDKAKLDDLPDRDTYENDLAEIEANANAYSDNVGKERMPYMDYTIDFTSSDYDPDLYYPVALVPTSTVNRLQHYRTYVILQHLWVTSTGRPTWSTHSSGRYSFRLSFEYNMSQWGGVEPDIVITEYFTKFIDNSKVVNYPIHKPERSWTLLYLRGGTNYECRIYGRSSIKDPIKIKVGNPNLIYDYPETGVEITPITEDKLTRLPVTGLNSKQPKLTPVGGITLDTSGNISADEFINLIVPSYGTSDLIRLIMDKLEGKYQGSYNFNISNQDTVNPTDKLIQVRVEVWSNSSKSHKYFHIKGLSWNTSSASHLEKKLNSFVVVSSGIYREVLMSVTKLSTVSTDTGLKIIAQGYSADNTFKEITSVEIPKVTKTNSDQYGLVNPSSSFEIDADGRLETSPTRHLKMIRQLTVDDDLNNITQPGIYGTNVETSSSYPANWPTYHGTKAYGYGVLVVSKPREGSSIIQTYYPEGRSYIISYTRSGFGGDFTTGGRSIWKVTTNHSAEFISYYDWNDILNTPDYETAKEKLAKALGFVDYIGLEGAQEICPVIRYNNTIQLRCIAALIRPTYYCLTFMNPTVDGVFDEANTVYKRGFNFLISLVGDSTSGKNRLLPTTDITHTLSFATRTKAGVVQVGDGLNIENGVISVAAPGEAVDSKPINRQPLIPTKLRPSVDLTELFNIYYSNNQYGNPQTNGANGATMINPTTMLVTHNFGMWVEYDFSRRTAKAGIFDTFSGYRSSTSTNINSHGMMVASVYDEDTKKDYIYTINTVGSSTGGIKYIEVIDWSTKKLVQRLSLASLQTLTGKNGFHEFNIDVEEGNLYFWPKDTSKGDTESPRYFLRARLPKPSEGTTTSVTFNGVSGNTGAWDVTTVNLWNGYTPENVLYTTPTAAVTRSVKVYNFVNSDLVDTTPITVNIPLIADSANSQTQYYIYNSADLSGTAPKLLYQDSFVKDGCFYMLWTRWSNTAQVAWRAITMVDIKTIGKTSGNYGNTMNVIYFEKAYDQKVAEFGEAEGLVEVDGKLCIVNVPAHHKGIKEELLTIDGKTFLELEEETGSRYIKRRAIQVPSPDNTFRENLENLWGGYGFNLEDKSTWPSIQNLLDTEYSDQNWSTTVFRITQNPWEDTSSPEERAVGDEYGYQMWCMMPLPDGSGIGIIRTLLKIETDDDGILSALQPESDLNELLKDSTKWEVISNVDTSDFVSRSMYSQLANKVDSQGTKITTLETNLASKANLSDVYNKTTIDSKVSQLNTAIGNCVTESELASKGYITSIPSNYVTESELNTELTQNYPTRDEVNQADQNLASNIEYIDLTLETVPKFLGTLSGSSSFPITGDSNIQAYLGYSYTKLVEAWEAGGFFRTGYRQSGGVMVLQPSTRTSGSGTLRWYGFSSISGDKLCILSAYSSGSSYTSLTWVEIDLNKLNNLPSDLGWINIATLSGGNTQFNSYSSPGKYSFRNANYYGNCTLEVETDDDGNTIQTLTMFKGSGDGIQYATRRKVGGSWESWTIF